MSIRSSPSIVTNGLVFNYDMSNNKSYRSPPIKNVLNQITPRGLSSGALYNFTSGTENVYIPSLGWVENCKYVDMYNDYNGGSNNCCPSPYGYGDSLTVSPSTLYTYAIVYKSVNSYTNPNYMYHYEFTSGGSYLTEYGVFGNNGSTAFQRYLGDDWYWASSTFTSNASAGLMNTGSWMYEYGRYNRFYVAKAMLVPGNYINMHPKFWPALDTTVTNTQTILDLTNQNTITVTSLTYANDGTFSFNGSDVLTIPNSSAFNMTEQLSIEAWVKFNGNSDDFIFEKGDVNTQYSLFSHGTDIVFRTFHSGDGSYHTQGPSKTTAAIVNGQWVHIVGSWDGVTKRIYVNGVLKDSVSKTGALVTTSKGSSVGRFGGDTTGYYFNGSIAKVAVYNIGLSESQVRQNFNAKRGIYGL